VAAAHDDAHLDTQLHALLYHIAHFADDVKVQSPVLVTGQRFTADFEKYTLVLWLVHTGIHSFISPGDRRVGGVFSWYLFYMMGANLESLIFRIPAEFSVLSYFRRSPAPWVLPARQSACAPRPASKGGRRWQRWAQPKAYPQCPRGRRPPSPPRAPRSRAAPPKSPPPADR